MPDWQQVFSASVEMTILFWVYHTEPEKYFKQLIIFSACISLAGFIAAEAVFIPPVEPGVYIFA